MIRRFALALALILPLAAPAWADEGSELADPRVVVDAAYVRERLDEITQDADLSRFIL